jgi:MFS family permease
MKSVAPPIFESSAAGDGASLAAAPVDAQSVIDGHQWRNFAAMVVYQVVLRAGWIFKTESIVMPAVLDLISGNQPWARQMLPLLNRLGQSVPPLLWARRVKIAPYKSRMLVSTTLAMASCFMLLAILWVVTGGQHTWWMPVVFLIFYGLFFAVLGVNQLVFSTAQGKLIAVSHRGRLLLVANTIGAVIAISCALLLLPRWLHTDSADIGAIFGFAAACFFLSAVATLFLVEPPDAFTEPRTSIVTILRNAWQPIQKDRHFRRLAFIASMYGVSMILFPHYQAVGREVLDLSLTNLVWWLVLQNVGTACFSIVAGPIADRYGNRLVLNTVMLGLCLAPLLTIVLAWIGPAAGGWFNWVFVLVGMTPLAIRSLHNYALEIAPPAEHPRYLSSLSLCMATPLIIVVPFGKLLECVPFDVLFGVVTVFILCGWLATFGMFEPRHDPEFAHAAKHLPQDEPLDPT